MAKRVGLLLDWNETFSGAGDFTVVTCEPEAVFGPDRWRCQGRLTTDTVERQPAVLLAGKEARMSRRPYVGQQVDVFYDPETADQGELVVYADDAQLGELARLYLGLVPLVMILVGAAGSLLGSALARIASRPTNTGSWWRTSPLVVDLPRRGVIWLTVGVTLFVVHQLLVRYVLGSAGVG